MKQTTWSFVRRGMLILLAFSIAALLWAPTAHHTPAATATAPVIVQGTDVATAAGAVRSVGGEITHQLGIIRAVAALLTPAQQTRLADREGILRIYEDRAVRTTDTEQLLPVADAYIHQVGTGANHNHGDDADLKSKADANSVHRRLLRFDLTGIPSKARVASAKLKLFVTHEKAGVTLNVHRVTRS